MEEFGSWKSLVKSEVNLSYYVELQDFIESEYLSATCFPPQKEIFKAFLKSDFDSTKVVIIGQDPYHGKGQANGLCFSVNEGVKIPPSLRNIFKELQADLKITIPESGNLERWAEQGVLLLNSVLTVKEASPGSHKNKGWELFTDHVIKEISDNKENIVFLLWGAYAIAKSSLIDENKHLILSSTHPSPFSAYKGFLGCQHFSKTNLYLQTKGLKEINW